MALDIVDFFYQIVWWETYLFTWPYLTPSTEPEKGTVFTSHRDYYCFAKDKEPMAVEFGSSLSRLLSASDWWSVLAL